MRKTLLFLISVAVLAEFWVYPSSESESKLRGSNQGGGVEAHVPVNAQSANAARVPKLVWPVGRANHDDVFVQLGPDSDPSPGVWTDWECSPQFTYDTHRGTDIMAYNFRLMDQGVSILAAADGTVTWTQTGYFDRNYWTPYVGLPNGINIRHPDGSDSQYFHLRQHSVSVQVGDVVEAGQVIGYMGSSGSSPNPHLHFELWQGGVSQNPNSGPCNSSPSLWIESFEYPGSVDLTILDWDLFLDFNLTGVESNNFIGDKRLKNRAFRPLTISKDLSQIGVWVQFQGLVGATYVVRVIDNEGNEFARTGKGVAFSRSVQWHALYFDFSSASTMESPEGSWSIEIIRDGQSVQTKTFEVGTATRYPIRFYPLAGRSFKQLGSEIRDTLRVVNAFGSVDYALLDAPLGVSIDGNEVVVSSGAEFSHRNGHFKVIATDQSGRTDTMYYHVVSPNLSLRGFVTEVNRSELPESFSLNQNYPNPFEGHTSVPFEIDRRVEASIQVFDISGKAVLNRELGFIGPGKSEIELDMTGYPSGSYVYELKADGRSFSKVMILLKGGN